ncbi:TonB-dependent receptor [Haliea sp. E17]|uniref:TonB-dependent receptor n=1 Tax=Haliea sp. E17 TaxID=3401576 RepID=UPI003AAE2D04
MKRFTPIAAALFAAQAAAEQLPMEHVLVSVPLHKKSAETALPVTVLSGDELHRTVASSLGATLDGNPGLASASFGPGVGQPVVRGQQGARVRVLQNGTSSADASAISADHAVALEPLLANSIEVLRGPATLLYGGGAIGGVVNVLDNRIPTALPDAPEGGVEYRHDNASDRDVVVARAETALGPLALHVDGFASDWSDLDIPGSPEATPDEDLDEHSLGTLENTAGDSRSLTLGGSYHFDAGFFGLAVNRLDNNYGIPLAGHDHAHEEDHDAEEVNELEEGGVTIEMEQTRYDAALHLHEPLPGVEVLSAFLTRTEYEHAEVEDDGAVGTRYVNDSWEGRLELVHQPLGPLHGVVGLQAVSGDFSAIGTEAFIPPTERDDSGLFLLEDYHVGDWLFEFGLRLDRDSRDPEGPSKSREFTAFSASASALWQLSPAWQVGSSLSRAERAPAIEELYSNTSASSPAQWVVHAATNAIEIGDDKLDTEVSNNIDLSLEWQQEGHFATLSLYYNDFSDYIGLFASGEEWDGVPVYLYAHRDAEFYGVEVDSEFSLVQTSAGEVRLRLFGDSVRGSLDGGGDVPRLPPLRLGARLSWTGDALSVWGQVLDAADQDRPGANELPTAGYTRWDLGAEYALPLGETELLLFATLNNLTDEEIRLSTSFLREVAPEAGRGVEAGLRLRF